jgi:hypothetical protein
MKTYQIEIKWGIIFVLMSLLWMLLEKLLGLHSTHIDKHALYTNFIAIPAIAIYVFALLEKRNRFYHGKMTYLQGFVSGIIISLIVMVFSPLTQYITVELITPQFFTHAIAFVVTEKKMTQEEAVHFYSLQNYIIQGLIGAPVMGLMTTAIVAIFTRKTS